MPNHNGPMTDTHLQALRRRNELRLHQSREQLGERWLLHSANAVRRAGPLFLPNITAGRVVNMVEITRDSWVHEVSQ